VEDLKIYDAIFWYYHMVNQQTEEVFLKAKSAMEYSVKMDPAYALGWAILGETYVAGFFKGYKTNIDQPLENAVQCAKTSLRIDPLCQHAYQTLGLANLFLHQRESCLKVAEQWMKLKPKAAGIAGGIGFCLICAGEYERGFKLLDDSIQLNPYYQWWLNGGLSFYFFQKKEYEDALYWAEKMNMPDVPWELLMKAASLAEMNNLVEASENILKMKQRFPELKDSIKPYLGAFLQSEELVNNLYAAIMKAEPQLNGH
jgi:Tfp pilus assembly protein PilF